MWYIISDDQYIHHYYYCGVKEQEEENERFVILPNIIKIIKIIICMNSTIHRPMIVGQTV